MTNSVPERGAPGLKIDGDVLLVVQNRDLFQTIFDESTRFTPRLPHGKQMVEQPPGQGPKMYRINYLY